jgi:murein DD-endopeptidase MepM/ murein hydrolase activator NlpD
VQVEVPVQAGDTLLTILEEREIDAPGLVQLLQTRAEALPLKRLMPGQRLLLRTDAAGQLQELVHLAEPYERLRLTRAATGFEILRERREYDARVAYVRGSVTRSLFEDAQQAGLSEPLILDFARIFGWDIDFALDLRPGDRFTLVYEEKYWLGQKVADGEILAAEFVNRGKRYRAIGYRQADGAVHYYTPEGKSLRRAFLRTPLSFSRVSSTFANTRYHPILRIRRAHKGVDYAAPSGTPVHATANGRIESLGRNGGYGNTVVIRHEGAYSTLYAHLSRVRDDLKVGRYVEQGDTIGYVGQTGLATGPHLHYEFRVNGIHHDPLAVELPHADPLATPRSEDFYRAAHEWSAQLDAIDGGHLLASAQSSGSTE